MDNQSNRTPMFNIIVAALWTAAAVTWLRNDVIVVAAICVAGAVWFLRAAKRGIDTTAGDAR